MRSNHPIETVRDVQVELKALRLHGMASAWGDLMGQGSGASIEPSRWLIEHLLQAEDVDRHMRSIAHQMKVARFPVHRDLAGFDFEVSCVDKTLIQKLADLSFTQDAQNAVLIGGPGTGSPKIQPGLPS
jgi:DNA replication protein DnaC